MAAVTKADLAATLNEELGLNKREAKEFVEMFFEEMRQSLEEGEGVKLSGFGNFILRDKNQRPGAIRRPARKSRSRRGASSPSARGRSCARGSKAMLEASNHQELPAIPGKRYFTIGEVAELCQVKPHVLRYWEQEFPMLEPVKRRGNRRYYQRQDVILIRQIRALLYEEGYTINGARQKLSGDEAKGDRQQARQIIQDTISELESVLRVLRA